MDKKLTKHDLKDPDAFISNMSRISTMAFDHRRTVTAVVAVVFGSGLLWAGMGFYNDRRENRAQTDLFMAEKKLKSQEEEFGKSTNPPTNPAEKLKKEPVKATGNLEADYKETVPLLKDVISKHNGTQASVIAALDLAKLYYDYKKYDEGIAVLEKTMDMAKHPVTRGLTIDQLANFNMAKGNCDKAIGYWQKLGQEKTLSFLQGSSLIKTGLCYEKLKQFDKAEQTYLRASGLTNDADTSKTAKKYLRLLKKGSA